jgi:hypothetical protein
MTARKTQTREAPKAPSTTSAGRIFVAAELALGAAGAAYFFASKPASREGIGNVVLCVGVVVVVAVIISTGYRRMRRRQADFVATANAAIRAVASRVGLDQVYEPPPATTQGPHALAFVEARGTVGGVRVTLFIDQARSDDMKTVLFFPDATSSDSTIKALQRSARRVPHERGLMLALRTPAWRLVGVEPGVESDVSRIIAVTVRAIDLLRPRATR